MDHGKMAVASRCWWQRWEACKRLLSEPQDVPEGELPAVLSEQLRRQGLI